TNGNVGIDGNVGIGTAPLPANKLTVKTVGGTGYGLVHTNDTVTMVTRFNDTDGFVGTFSNHNFSLLTDNIPALTIRTNGNIGIGQAPADSTGAKLTVQGGASGGITGLTASAADAGVLGVNTSGDGVRGVSTSGVGVLGRSTFNMGVLVES